MNLEKANMFNDCSEMYRPGLCSGEGGQDGDLREKELEAGDGAQSQMILTLRFPRAAERLKP